jgi:DNA invertase Pin-like site-specific DNA recombinase
MDKESGKSLERDGYQMLKNHLLRDGDTLVVMSLDRLSRNKSHIKNELEYYKQRRIRVKILDIPTTLIDLPEEQDWIFDMINNILIEVLASIAEQERVRTLQRQAQGIAAAKEKGKHLGRPKADYPPNWDEVYQQWVNDTITAKQAMEILGLKRSTFYKLVQIHRGG